MATANVIVLLFNGLTLALALGLLLLVLWQDTTSETNRFFSLFLLMVLVWASGSLLGRAAAYVNAGQRTVQTGMRLLDVGFSGSAISVYIYSAVLTGQRGRWFKSMALAGLSLVFTYQLLLIATNTHRSFEITEDGVLQYSFDTSSIILYLAFQVSTVVLVWRNRRKIRMLALTVGLLLFCIGQMLGLLSPRFRMLGVSEDMSSVAALIISYAVVRQQIMNPLLGRAKQLEAVRDVGLAVTSRLHLQDTLSAIAAQAAGLLEADGAAIFLKHGTVLKLAAVYNLPGDYVGLELLVGQGVAGTVAAERRGRRVDNYRRDWTGEVDMPWARQAFGAVVCVPLMFAGEVVGVLFVAEGRQGRLFSRDDMHLLELLGPQAAVAITNSSLFEAERRLSEDLVTAKDRLETVLTSTENPVVAVDRKFQIIFANPAAINLLGNQADPIGQRIADMVPRDFLPPVPRRALRELASQHVHVYELVSGERTYLCHVAEMGRSRAEGWVVVLNDVSRLKELDRLKSQMVQMTSHDLKNPLQAAMSYVELLEEDGQAVFTSDMHDYVAIVWTQLRRMYRIISGILDLERVQSGTPAFELVALEDVLPRVVDELADQARSKGIALSLSVEDDLPSVLGEPQMLSQAFVNIVENAVKFTPQGGSVSISAAEKSGCVIIDVTDTGIGIPQEEQEHVFERFYRVHHQEVSNVGGSGLGLSLVKAVVDRHGGRVYLESEPGKGTVFHVLLNAISDGDLIGETGENLHAHRG